LIYIFKILNPAGLLILPHLLRQMPSRIGDYSGTPSFFYLRQPIQSLNLGHEFAPIKANCMPLIEQISS
jgi:hypothetical protein